MQFTSEIIHLFSPFYILFQDFSFKKPIFKHLQESKIKNHIAVLSRAGENTTQRAPTAMKKTMQPNLPRCECEVLLLDCQTLVGPPHFISRNIDTKINK